MKDQNPKQSSYTIGTAGKDGAIKIYFDIDEDIRVIQGKIARAKVLYEQFCLNEPSAERLFELGDVPK